MITTETKSENTKVELDFYDQQPIWIYVFLTCVMSFLTLISTPEEKKEIKTDKKDLRARVIARIEGGMSNLQISTELGIDRREVAKIKSSLVQSRPVNVQSMSNVINLDERGLPDIFRIYTFFFDVFGVLEVIVIDKVPAACL